MTRSITSAPSACCPAAHPATRVFEAVRRQDNPRLFVLNPHDRSYFWIEAVRIGPIDPTEHRTEKKPAGQDFADAVCDD